MAIIVFQHSDHGRPGRLGLTLRDQGLRLDIRRPDLGQSVPADLDNVEGVISLGGPQSVAAGADRPAWLDEELAFLKRTHEAELPVIGVCLGHQMLAAALGGEVARMPAPEIGFHTVHLSAYAQTETILSGVAWNSPQFCHHEDEVKKLPPGAITLASSKACAIQAFKVGLRSFGFQFHFEADRDMLNHLINVRPQSCEQAGVTPSDLLGAADRAYPDFARIADRLSLNIATYLFPSKRRAAASV